MKKTVKRKTAAVRTGARYGEAYLSSIAAIRLTLENGAVVEFDLGEQTSIEFGDIESLHRQLAEASGRLAFWRYQEKRALSALRAEEKALEHLTAQHYIVHRKWIDEHTTDMPTEANVRARVDAQDEIFQAKKRVDSIRRRYDVLATVAEAVEHRSYALRRLAAPKGLST